MGESEKQGFQLSFNRFLRVVKHARSFWLLLAEGHLSRRLFGAMVLRITALLVPDG